MLLVAQTGEGVFWRNVGSESCVGRDQLFVFNFGCLCAIFVKLSLHYAELFGLIDICRGVATYALNRKL